MFYLPDGKTERPGGGKRLEVTAWQRALWGGTCQIGLEWITLMLVPDKGVQETPDQIRPSSPLPVGPHP